MKDRYCTPMIMLSPVGKDFGRLLAIKLSKGARFLNASWVSTGTGASESARHITKVYRTLSRSGCSQIFEDSIDALKLRLNSNRNWCGTSVFTSDASGTKNTRGMIEGFNELLAYYDVCCIS
ncbi:unnamed protein product [Ixodes persulcatus]